MFVQGMRSLILQSDPRGLHTEAAHLALFIRLFLLVFDVYRGIANKDITESIKSEMSGDLEDALLAVGKFPAFKLCLQTN